MNVLQRYHENIFSTEELFKFWAGAILLLMPVLIFTKLIINFIFIIVNRIVTNQVAPKFSDELDKLIDLRATVHFGWVFMLGYLLSMGALVIGMTPLIMFNILLCSAILGGIAIDVTQLYFYRKGI